MKDDAITLVKEIAKPLSSLRQKLDQIDDETIKEAGPSYCDGLIGLFKGNWRKGWAIIDKYPEAETYQGKPGGDRQSQKAFKVILNAFSWANLEHEAGRPDISLKKWVKLALEIGKGEDKFLVWAKGKRRLLLDSIGRRARGYLSSGKLELPKGKFRIIYADPPWFYSAEQHGAWTAQETVLETHYSPMKIEEICAMTVKKITHKNAVLFLWTTVPKLYEAKQVIDAWGFEYKTNIIWDKIKHNVGHYFSIRHEHLLLSTRGSCLPDSKKLIDSVVSIERTEHSKKPERFRNIIDELYVPPKDKIDRIELFARGEIPIHWKTWGNE